MIKLYFKQAFHLLRENKLLSSISIIGTALAIAMIMVIVITLRATIAPFAPETYRDRMLIFRYAGLHLIGIWFPARQAIRIQPAEALREE